MLITSNVALAPLIPKAMTNLVIGIVKDIVTIKATIYIAMLNRPCFSLYVQGSKIIRKCSEYFTEPHKNNKDNIKNVTLKLGQAIKNIDCIHPTTKRSIYLFKSNIVRWIGKVFFIKRMIWEI